MTNTVRSHAHQALIDNTIFGRGLADSVDVTFIQDQLADNGAGELDRAAGTFAAVKYVAPTDTLYLTEPGDTSPISYMDIHQGSLGDCFLLSAIGELALFHPSAITSMIHANTNGTETVTMYNASNGSLPSFYTSVYKATSEVVNNSMFSSKGVNSNYSFSQDIVGNLQEVWPQVLETANAMLNNGFNNIANGGYPVVAMEELTGMAASTVQTSQMNWANLINDVQQGDLLQFDTVNASGFGLVSGHSYMFKSIDTKAQNVQLANPWGTQEPAAIPFSRLASAGIMQIDVGHVRA
jgi:hypothetical protein